MIEILDQAPNKIIVGTLKGLNDSITCLCEIAGAMTTNTSEKLQWPESHIINVILVHAVIAHITHTYDSLPDCRTCKD